MKTLDKRMSVSTRANNAWYALRRTVVPWRFEEVAQELLQTLPEMRVDELILKIDTEEFTHGQPDSQWVDAYLEKLAGFTPKLTAMGIEFSINPWITVGHNDRARDGSKSIPGLHTMVGHDGTQCTCCACHLCEQWRAHVRDIWSRYARLKPRVIWVEDDIRTWNHLPVKFSCFCERHLARFSQLVGKPVGREELVAAITAPGRPHPWRKLFLDMQRDVQLEVAQLLTKAVQEVSPETTMGLMSSGPHAHCIEGRDWGQLANVMSGKRNRLFSRPPLGSYYETSLRALYYTADSIAITRHMLPAGTIELTEVENTPFTQYSKSVSMTFLQMAISYALGCRGATLNIFDHVGSPMSIDPDMVTMLGSDKDYFNALASACQGEGRQRGVQILFSPRYGYHKQLVEGDGCQGIMSKGQCLSLALLAQGISTTYTDERVRASVGQTLRCFDDDQIMKLLADGLFIDAGAARVLVERGFGQYIGIESIDAPVCIDTIEPLSVEEFHNTDFGGEKCKMLTLTPRPGDRPDYSRAKLSADVVHISHMMDIDLVRKYECMFAYENSLGGRVVVHLLDWPSIVSIAFNHMYRRQQMQNVMRWLNRSPLPAAATQNILPLVIRRDIGQKTILSAFNLILDEYHEMVLEVGDERELASVELLDDKGNWIKPRDISVTRNGREHKIHRRSPLTYNRPMVLRLSWRKA